MVFNLARLPSKDWLWLLFTSYYLSFGTHHWFLHLLPCKVLLWCQIGGWTFILGCLPFAFRLTRGDHHAHLRSHTFLQALLIRSSLRQLVTSHKWVCTAACRSWYPSQISCVLFCNIIFALFAPRHMSLLSLWGYLRWWPSFGIAKDIAWFVWPGAWWFRVWLRLLGVNSRSASRTIDGTVKASLILFRTLFPLSFGWTSFRGFRLYSFNLLFDGVTGLLLSSLGQSIDELLLLVG